MKTKQNPGNWAGSARALMNTVTVREVPIADQFICFRLSSVHHVAAV